MFLRKIIILYIAILSLAAPASAEGFGSFGKEDLNPPGGAKRMVDLTGSAPVSKVDVFTIAAGYCNPQRYDPSTPDSDCYYNSTRAQMVQQRHTQPSDAWYGWWMYLPDDFPYGTRQVKGHYEFAYWHNKQCPHLTFASIAGKSNDLVLQTNIRVGNYDCRPNTSVSVARFSDLVGRWTQFEVFVRWGDAAKGHVTLYINGDLALDRDMATITPGMEAKNYFKYGIYLCCTADIARIKPMQAMFAAVRSARSREGLSP
jgi:hypothetical protein